ncbi:L,D-transpeptidase [Streptomyces celluloflavus]|uniref:L,D-transpeptidase n=1 Tax=Streptomyces celluloflavus TaxID=58344 RepID=A0ABW7R4C6_9ACTN
MGRRHAGRAAATALAAAALLTAAVGCRPVTVTGAGASGGRGGQQQPFLGSPPPPPTYHLPTPPARPPVPHRTVRLRPTAPKPVPAAKPSYHRPHPPAAKPAGSLDRRCLTGRVLCISKRSDTLTWMVDGKAVSTMDVRFGAEYTPTREGTFGVTFKSRRHVSTLYHSAMPYAMFFSGGQAVHYSSDFAARGYTGASHGCVNVRDRQKIAALFAAVRPGDKVVVYH